MIQNNELRVGNYINDPDGAIIRVKEIFTTSVDAEDRFGMIVLQWAEPIPITSEILAACGFKVDSPSNVNCYVLKDFVVFMGHEPSGIVDPYVSVGFRGGVVVTKYLHQLQNLHFALTGKELQVNLNPATA